MRKTEITRTNRIKREKKENEKVDVHGARGEK